MTEPRPPLKTPREFCSYDLDNNDRAEILRLVDPPPAGNMPDWLALCMDMRALGVDESDYLAWNARETKADGSPWPETELRQQWASWGSAANSGKLIAAALHEGWRPSRHDPTPPTAPATSKTGAKAAQVASKLPASETAPETKTETKTETKAESKAESKAATSKTGAKFGDWRDEAADRLEKERPTDNGDKARALAAEYLENERQLGGAAEYLEKRGINDKTLVRFGPGYCHEYGDRKQPRCIIFYPGENPPYWMARATDPDTPKAYKAMNAPLDIAGGHRLFNRPALVAGRAVVYLMEGEIDAMSIEQMGWPAMAGKSRLEILAAVHRAGSALTARTVVVIPDNDGPGGKYAKTMAAAAKEAGLEAYIRALPSHTPDGKPVKDANDLLRVAPDLLRRWLADTKIWLDAQRRRLEGWNPRKLAAMSGEAWDTALFGDPDRGTPALATGFGGLDRILGGGLRPGLYLIGAPPGAGKTTLALQICDHLAQNGRKCLFFSVEMEPQAIVAKSLARMTWDLHKMPTPGETVSSFDGQPLDTWTPRDIMYTPTKNPSADANLQRTRERRRAWSANVTMVPHEAAGTPAQIVEAIAGYCRATGHRPDCVIIDYLQRLTPDRPADDTKKFLDGACRSLALAAHGQETKTAIILIAALNREANKAAKITLESFTGSAGIGYEADCALGLREVDNAGRAAEDDETLANLMQRPLRRYRLQVLKARMGQTGTVDLYLYGVAGRFLEPPPLDGSLAADDIEGPQARDDGNGFRPF